MSKKNLLLLVPSLKGGGQEKVAVHTAAILFSDYNVTIAAFNLENSVYIAPCPTVDLRTPVLEGYWKKSWNVMRRVHRVKKLKRELQIDATISFGRTANVVNAFSRVSDKIILSIRGYAELSNSVLGRFINKIIFTRADIVSCVALKMSEDLVALYRVSTDKVYVVFNPYNINEITNLANMPLSIPLTIKRPAIVTMGRLEATKGYRHLIHAFSLVHRVMPETSLVFVGDGSKIQELQEMVRNFGLEEAVVFTGFQSNPYSCLSKCDIYALSSINEGFPNALVEAMVCGLPVVATDCKSGPREILTEIYSDSQATEIEYADYGILIPPYVSDDSYEPKKDQQLAQALLRLLMSKEMCDHYKEKAIERARDFSFEGYKSRLVNMLER